MTSESQIIVYNPDVNLTERKSNLNNDIQEVVTVGDLRGYKVYTALLTQSGGDDPDSLFGGQGSILDFGQTYFIASNPDNYDLTIYGAANSNVGTYFVCNDPTSPVLVYTDSLQLDVNYGAPLVTVLENTIGNITWRYISEGIYKAVSTGNFTANKTVVFISSGSNYSNLPSFYPTTDTENNDQLFISTAAIENPPNYNTDGSLFNTPIEIRVYE
jgi:hypothetical protein